MNHPVMDYYGFSKMPFGKNIEPAQTFASANLSNAVSMLSLGVAEEDFLLVWGPVGCGKSCAIRAFASSLDADRFALVYLRGAFLSHTELVKAILQGLSVEPPFSPAKARALYYKTVSDYPKKPVVIIDDAQELKESALLFLKSLTNHDQDSKNRITFILSGQPELRDILRFSKFSSIQQRIRLSFAFTGLSLEETCRYIDHSVNIAGRPSKLFSDEAKNEIHKRSQGIPRKINTLGLRSLLFGAAEKKEIIDAKDVPHDDE
jgi:type II secretory pathway predicted ATPase ExeA